MCEYVVVFFSSRRRHTRYWRDWSSDVCSSDLAADAEEAAAAPGSESRSGRGPGRAARTGDDGEGLGRRPAAARAEAPERRRRTGDGREQVRNADKPKTRKASYWFKHKTPLIGR